jgi:drug/metabolite transporter, DME family
MAVATSLPTKTSVPIVASLLVAAAGLVWSLGAVTARLAKHTDAWQYLVWRSVGVLLVMEVMTLAKRQRPLVPQAYRTGRMMQMATFGLLLASLSYVYALKNTTAANAAFLSSLTPLIAAVLGRVLLKERLSRVTIGCITMALGGLLLMVLSDLNAGNMLGNAAAMMSSLGFAIYMICIRSSAARNWSPVLPGYAVAMIALCGTVTLMNGKTLVPPLFDIAMAMLHGGVFIVIGTLLFNLASKSVPAVGMAVLSQVENVFVPVWIFVWFSDIPKATALIGGAIILAAVLTKAILDARPAATSLVERRRG